MQHLVIGEGPVGFTAVGLDLVGDRVLGQLSLPTDVDVTVEVPAFGVVAADVFASFMGRNGLHSDDLVGLSDRQIARRFQEGELPQGLAEQLADLAASLDGPLVVRPSSVLEASLERSIGGVYVAKPIPNTGGDSDRRQRQLAAAVKLVWSSTFFSDAVSWRLGAGQKPDSEQMAVVVQRAVGSTHGSRFYPTVSLVARSYNHYPVPGNEPDEGVVTLALGFGRIIEDLHSWSYCPERPTSPPPFRRMSDLLKYTQTSFWALDLEGGETPDPTRASEFIVRLGLKDAESDGTLGLLASSYDRESDRLREGLDGDGPRVLTFAPLLASKRVPFTSVIKNVMDQARSVTGREVVLEMAATLDPESGVPVRFGILQMKTMAGRAGGESLHVEDLQAEDVFVASESCLGNGVRVDINDVVYLKPDVFDRNQTRTMCAELDAVNRGLLTDGRPAAFIGFGRWGTTDDRYGLPVRWGQISSAQVIVEIAFEDAPLNVSRGTHFFHHLLSQKVLYFSVEGGGGREVDLQWLDGLEPVWEGRYVRHVRLDAPLEVNVDGAGRRGVIRRGAGT